MPLEPGDIELLSLKNRMVKDARGKLIAAKEITFRVRGLSEETIWIPAALYDPAMAEQEIEQAAAGIVFLLEKYPAQG